MPEQNARVGIFLIHNGALFSFDQERTPGKMVDEVDKPLVEFHAELIAAKDLPANVQLETLPKGQVLITNNIFRIEINNACIVYLPQIYTHFNIENEPLVEVSLTE